MLRFYAQLTLLLTFTTLIGFACSGSESEKPAPPPADTVTTGTPGDSVTITLVATDTTDAFSLLQQTHAVVSKATAMGIFVQQVDSLASGNGAFWMFSVNDSMPMVAADKCPVLPGDTVRWHLRFSDE